MKLTIHFDTIPERDAKLRAVMERFGYVVTPSAPERITVATLAQRAGRKVNTVSRSLRRPSCPPFVGLKGKARYLWIEPNADLLTFLAENRKGHRP